MRIAAVSRDPDERMQLARAFDEAPPTWLVSLHDDAPPTADVIVCGPGIDIEGAIPFDPQAPQLAIAEVQRRVRSCSVGRRIFVCGATGGSGATTLALHLAAAGRACVVEASRSGVRKRLGLASARPWPTATDEELAPLPVAPGLRVLLAPPTFTIEDTRRIVDRAASTFSSVIVDCESRDVEELVSPGDIGVLVSLPTRPAIEHAKDIVGLEGPRWAVVTNRIGPGGCLTRRRLEVLLDHRIAIELPCSAALRDSEDEGALLTSPMSPWWWKVKRLWRALETA